MKFQHILTSIFVVAIASIAIASVTIWPKVSPESKIEFRKNGDELTAYITIHANNSPAIIDTSFVIDEEKKSITLDFVVIQNIDIYRRSIRQITPTWQLGEINQNDYSFVINGSVVALKTKQTETLLPKKKANK